MAVLRCAAYQLRIAHYGRAHCVHKFFRGKFPQAAPSEKGSLRKIEKLILKLHLALLEHEMLFGKSTSGETPIGILVAEKH